MLILALVLILLGALIAALLHRTIGIVVAIVGIVLLVIALLNSSSLELDVLAGAPAFLLARKLPLTRLRS